MTFLEYQKARQDSRRNCFIAQPEVVSGRRGPGIYRNNTEQTLERELVEIKARLAKEEATCRAEQKEIQLKAQALPMTKERKAFYETQAANRGKREQGSGDSIE